MEMHEKHYDLYRVVNEEHDILIYAEDRNDALELVSDTYPHVGTDVYVFHADESKYAHLHLEPGRSRDLHK